MRAIIYILLILSFGIGAYLKQFGGALPHEPFAIFAFCGTFGLLLDYAWRIRKTWETLIPLLLACEVLGDLLYNGQFRQIAFYVYLPGALLFPVYGILFFRKGVLINQHHPSLSWKLIILGVLSTTLFSWEVATYFPAKLNPHAPLLRVLFLITFAFLLFIDFSTRFPQNALKQEKQILRVSLVVISIMYFVKFVFK